MVLVDITDEAARWAWLLVITTALGTAASIAVLLALVTRR